MKLTSTCYTYKDFSSSFARPEPISTGLAEVKEKRKVRKNGRFFPLVRKVITKVNRQSVDTDLFCLSCYHENHQSIDLNNPQSFFVYIERANIESV